MLTTCRNKHCARVAWFCSAVSFGIYLCAYVNFELTEDIDSPRYNRSSGIRVCIPYDYEGKYMAMRSAGDTLNMQDGQTNTIYETRLRRIHDVCLQKGWTNNLTNCIKTRKLRLILVDDKHKLVYCPIAKVGSSTFRQLLLSKSGAFKTGERVKHVHQDEVLEKGGLRFLSNYTTYEIEYILANYFKFIVVRHPFDRLVSAFNDKFRGMPINIALRFTDLIRQHFGNNTKVDNAARITIDANQFLELVATEPIRFRDGHWDNYARFCDPCVVQYDHVVYMETFEDDIGLVLDHMKDDNGTRPELPTSRVRRRISTKLKLAEATNTFRKVNSTIIEHLFGIYGRDFELFGYKWNKTRGAGCVQGIC